MSADHLCDYTARIGPSPQLKDFLREHLKGENEEEITVNTVRKIDSIIKREKLDVRLHQLMKGCQIILPQPTTPPRSKELEARIEKLKEQMERREYVQMTKSVDAVYRSQNVQEFRSDVRMVQSHMAAAFNLLITVGACFLFGYKVVDFLFSVPLNLASKILWGLFFGAIGAMADLYFLIKQIDS